MNWPYLNVGNAPNLNYRKNWIGVASLVAVIKFSIST